MTAPAPLKHAAVVCVLVAISAATYIPAFGFPPVIPPFNNDNVVAFVLAAQDEPDFFSNPPEHYFRPLAYTSMWAQYQLHGLRPSLFFTVNIALWLACALCAYALVFRSTASALAGGVAAVAMLLDIRSTTALIWIIDRQSTLACLFGGLALLLVYGLPRTGRLRRPALVGVSLLLLAAALSKEYGFAFCAAVGAVALLGRPDDRRPLIVAILAAAGAYIGLRWGVAGGSTGLGGSAGFCENMGYLGEIRETCYDDLDFAERVRQHAWNIGATFVGTLFPSIFGGYGNLLAPTPLAGTFGVTVSFPLGTLVFPAVVFACAVVGWVKRPRVTLPLLALIVANALLSFALFRPRNQLAAVLGLYVSAGIGVVPTVHLVRDRARALADRARVRMHPRAGVLAALVAGVLFAASMADHARDVKENIESEGADYAQRDPCDAIGPADVFVVGPEIPEALRAKFGLEPTECP